jgi:hypothetical protein
MDVGIAEAGQRCDEPLHREEEGRPHLDILAETWPMGISPFADEMWILMDQDVTMACWTFSRACGNVLGFCGHVWQVAGAPGGATSCSVDDDYFPKRANVSPLGA